VSNQVNKKGDDKKKRRNKNNLFTRAYDTKQTFSPQQIKCLDDIAQFFNYHKRKYNKMGEFNDKTRKHYVQNTVFENQEGIHQSMSYRFFKGIMQEIKGQHQSIQSNRENYLIDKMDRLDDVEKEIQKLKTKYENLHKNREKIVNHNFDNEKNSLLEVIRAKYRKRQHIINAINKLSKKDDYSICFGTKRLMKQRHSITSKEALKKWKEQWYKKRNGQFSIVGSWDEVYGNTTCQARYDKESDKFSIRLRIPYELESQHGEYLTLENITIPNYFKNKLKKEIEKHQCKAKNKNALSFRFIKINDHQYRIIFILNHDNETIKTHSKKGVIGVDVNADHFALVDIDSKGNIQNTITIPYNVKGKTSHQRKTNINEALKSIRLYALEKKKHIVIERLNFKQKRQQLYKTKNKAYARMLSAFAYQQIQQGLMSLEHEYGIKVNPVSPAYTSLLGKTVAADKSMTIHQAAAWFIAKRFYKLKERIKKQFKYYHRSKPFMVYIPRAIYREHNMKKLGSFLSDVEKYINGSLSLKKQKALNDMVVLLNGTNAIKY